MSGIGEASGAITLAGAIFSLAHFVEALKQSKTQLARYVVILRSIDRTTDLIESLAAASEESKELQTLSAFFNGNEHSLISSCRSNTKAILKDANNLIEICKQAESEKAQERIKEWLRRLFKNHAKSVKWVFNESYMKDLINAATQHESSLFMAYSSLMLAGNEIRQSNTQLALSALADTLTRQFENFIEAQKQYQRHDIEVLRSVALVEQPESGVKRLTSSMRKSRSRLTLSLGGGSKASLGADASIKNVNTQSDFGYSEPGKQDLQTIAVIRSDGRMDSILGSSAQSELVTDLSEQGVDEALVEPPSNHTDSPEQPGAASAVTDISSMLGVEISTEEAEDVPITETQTGSTSCDSAAPQKPANYGESSHNISFSMNTPTAADDKSNSTSDAQVTLSVNETVDTIVSTLVADMVMVKFCVKSMTVHRDGSLALILQEPCRADVDQCEHISLASQFDIDYQKPPGVHSVSLHRGPAHNISFPAPATIALSVLYGCRSGGTHTLLIDSCRTQKQLFSSQSSAKTLLVVVAQGEGMLEGESRETPEIALSGNMMRAYNVIHDEAIEPARCESSIVGSGEIFTAVPCECGHHTLVPNVDIGHSNQPWFMRNEVKYSCSMCHAPIRVPVHYTGLGSHSAIEAAIPNTLVTMGRLARKGLEYLAERGTE